MAGETSITKTTIPGRYSTTGAALTQTAIDTVNNNKVVAANKLLIVAWNSNAGAQTVTITSTADAKTGRTGDVSAQSLAADEIRAFVIGADGWQDGDGNVIISGSHADVKIMAMDL